MLAADKLAERDLLLDAARGLLERDLKVVAKVGAVAAAVAPPAPEHLVKDAAAAAALAEDLPEDVERVVEPARAAGARARPLERGVPEPVVGSALLGVLQRLVGLGDLLEHLLGLLVAGILVRVVLDGLLAIRLLQLLLRRAPGDAEQVIIVLLGHASGRRPLDRFAAGDDDGGRAQQAPVEDVARAHDLEDLLRLHVRARLVGYRLVLVRVEGLAQRIDLLQPVGRKRGLELLLHELDSARERLELGLRLLRRGEPEGQVVQRGQEVLEEPGRGEEAQLLLLAHGPSAEILEVGRGAQVAVAVLRRLLSCRGERLVRRRRVLPGIGRLVFLGVFRFWAVHGKDSHSTTALAIVQVCRTAPSGIARSSSRCP